MLERAEGGVGGVGGWIFKKSFDLGSPPYALQVYSINRHRSYQIHLIDKVVTVPAIHVLWKTLFVFVFVLQSCHNSDHPCFATNPFCIHPSASFWNPANKQYMTQSSRTGHW